MTSSTEQLEKLLTDCTVKLHIVGLEHEGGTGFFIAPRHILTCSHVVRSGEQVEATWNGERYPLTPVKRLSKSPNEYPDLLLLEISLKEHPCVLFDDGNFTSGDKIYGFGYPLDNAVNVKSTSFRGEIEGISFLDEIKDQPIVTFKNTQIIGGMSGSPVMNVRTGGVCGIIKRTREEIVSRAYDAGGRFISVKTIRESFPELVEAQRQFHIQYPEWSRLQTASYAEQVEIRLTSQLNELIESVNLISQRANSDMFGDGIKIVELPLSSLHQNTLSEQPTALDDDLKEYYSGNRSLSWDVITKNGDIERDQTPEILSMLSADFVNTRMICLVGEMGAGKSTVAWRIAFQLRQLTGYTLLHIRLNETPEIWFRLESRLQQLGKPTIVLVDDVFRSDKARHALELIDPHLSTLIISTSLINELPVDLNLPFKFDRIHLNPPSDYERTKVLQKFGIKREEMRQSQLRRLDTANSWLVMIHELVTGKSLSNTVSRRLLSLQEQDPIVYRAYEYVAFAGQFGLSIPRLLLLKLDSRGEFYKLEERSSAQGFIYLSDTDSDAVGAQHQLIAREASLQHYRRAPQIVSAEFLKAASPKISQHRSFIGLLLRHVAEEYMKEIEELLHDEHAQIVALETYYEIADMVNYWIPLYESLGQSEKVAQLKSKVLEEVPNSIDDFIAAHNFVRLYGSKKDARKLLTYSLQYIKKVPREFKVVQAYLTTVDEWGTRAQITAALRLVLNWLQRKDISTKTLQLLVTFIEKHASADEIAQSIGFIAKRLRKNKEDRELWKTYLSIVKHRRYSQQIIETSKETENWLLEHSDDLEIRMTYLAFIEYSEDKSLIAQALQATSIWLNSHPDDYHIRHFYIGLVERHGSLEDKKLLIDEVSDWLKTHPSDHYIRSYYIRFIERYGTAQQQCTAMSELTEWLKQNPRNANIRLHFLGFLRRYGTREQIVTAISETSEWLRLNSEVTLIKQLYIELAREWGTDSQIHNVIQELSHWVRENRTDDRLTSAYLRLVERQGDVKAIRNTLEYLYAWLKINIAAHHTREAYLVALNQYGTKSQIRRSIQATQIWLKINAKNSNIRHALLRLVERHGTTVQINRAIQETTTWLKLNQGDTTVRLFFLDFLGRRGSDLQISNAIGETSAWLRLTPEDSTVRIAFLKLVDQKGTKEQFEQVVHETILWLQSNPDNTHFRKFYLSFLKKRGTKEQLKQVVHETILWLQSNPEDSEVREAYLGLVEKSGDVAQLGMLIESTGNWLKENPSNINVRRAYISLVRRRGSSEQQKAIIAETSHWLLEHNNNVEILSSYLLLVAYGTQEQIQSAIYNASIWLQESQGNSGVREAYLQLLDLQGIQSDINEAINSTVDWLKVSRVVGTSIYSTLVKLMEKHWDREQIETETSKLFEWVLPNYQNSYIWRLCINLLKRWGSEVQIADAIDELTILFEEDAIKDDYLRQLHLEIVVSYGTGNQQERLLNHITKWFKDVGFSKDYWQTRLSFGRLLFERMRYNEAEAEFQNILSKNPSLTFARFCHAWSLYYQNQKSEALVEMLRIKKDAQDKGHVIDDVLLHLARYHRLEHLLSEATSFALEAVTLTPTQYANHLELGLCYQSQNEHWQALTCFKVAFTLIPEDASFKVKKELNRLINQTQVILEDQK